MITCPLHVYISPYMHIPAHVWIAVTASKLRTSYLVAKSPFLCRSFLVPCPQKSGSLHTIGPASTTCKIILNNIICLLLDKWKICMHIVEILYIYVLRQRWAWIMRIVQLRGVMLVNLYHQRPVVFTRSYIWLGLLT